jgi:hypothetical protein
MLTNMKTFNGGLGMELSRRKCSRSLLGAAAGFLFAGLIVATGGTQASAQAANAADLCTPDVMRLCNAYIPDADRIVVCLQAKRRQLSSGCRGALTPTSVSASAKKKRRVRNRSH